MSYVKDTLIYIRDHGPATNKQVAEGINASRQQARDAIAQLMASGRVENKEPKAGQAVAYYAITDYGLLTLECGSLKRWKRPESKPRIANIGIVSRAIRTQPVSVWSLAA